MGALDDRQVVGGSPGVRLVERICLGAGVDGESARHGDVHVVRDVAVHLDADILGTEHIRVGADDARPIDERSRAVDDVAAEDVGIADHERMLRVVTTAGAPDMNIPS